MTARDIAKVVVLGANGAMGAASGALFAAAGIPTTLLARDGDRAAAGKARAAKILGSEALLASGTYAELAHELADADLIFEALAEDLTVKGAMFERLEALRRPGTVVATVSSGLSIAAMCSGRSVELRRHFLGIHLFNPPKAMLGCELVPHAETDPDVVARIAELLRDRLGRRLVVTRDTPAFCANRVGFKLLNECAQLAEARGTVAVDTWFGWHTGRALPPLATIDFVGWDVHRAIVDNLCRSTMLARASFVLPGYMERLIARGQLGNKTPERGGFYRRLGADRKAPRAVLDPATGEHLAPVVVIPDVVAKMQELHLAGRHRDAFAVLAAAPGDAAIMRRGVLGYVQYGLALVGDVVEAVADVDRIMRFGFGWAPPGMLVDLLGARRAIALLEGEQLDVPHALVRAAEHGEPLHDGAPAAIAELFRP